jgi:hypothetical protein
MTRASRPELVIPSRSNREGTHDYNMHIHRKRHLVGCFISKVQHYRRTLSRLERQSNLCLGFLRFVVAPTSLRWECRQNLDISTIALRVCL